MNFTTPIFVFFFGIVFLVRWNLSSIQNPKQKNTIILFFLTVSSYLFYMSWSFSFSFLLLLTTLYDFYLANQIVRSNSVRSKKFYVTISILINLLLLGFFKYYYFLSTNVNGLFLLLGYSVPLPILSVVLPAGISFYTFQSISYTVDVYRGEVLQEKSFLHYMFYLSFFPQLVAGPIVVAKYFLPQIETFSNLRFSDICLKEGLYFLASGFIKKAVLADTIASISDIVFRAPDHLSFSALAMGVLSYSIQIYCDFSGYTDIARGSALLLGIKLPENFSMPYFAGSFKNFWNCWHITLSSWLKSYLYIPLGGNRKHEYCNLLLTMVIGGLWHGASWNFVIWGFLHGTALVVERYTIRLYEKYIMKFTTNHSQSKNSILTNSHVYIKIVVQLTYAIFVFLTVSMFWIFFRAETLDQALVIVKGIFSMTNGIDLLYSQKKIFVIIFLAVFLFHWIGTKYQQEIEAYLHSPLKRREAIFLAVLTIGAVLLTQDTKPFIYFVF